MSYRQLVSVNSTRWGWRRKFYDSYFSTFLLQRNLPQICALLTEPHAMIQVPVLLQPHRTVVANFVPSNFGLFRQNPG